MKKFNWEKAINAFIAFTIENKLSEHDWRYNRGTLFTQWLAEDVNCVCNTVKDKITHDCYRFYMENSGQIHKIQRINLYLVDE